MKSHTSNLITQHEYNGNAQTRHHAVLATIVGLHIVEVNAAHQLKVKRKKNHIVTKSTMDPITICESNANHRNDELPKQSLLLNAANAIESDFHSGFEKSHWLWTEEGYIIAYVTEMNDEKHLIHRTTERNETNS